MTEAANTTKLYPAWRQAEAELLANDLRHGSIITDEFLREAFGLVEPKTIAEFQRNALIYLRQITALKDSLLQGRKMLLVAEAGVGFRVALPEEQTKLSMHNRTREMKAAMQKMITEITHVDTAKLDDEQRRENADAIAKLGQLRAITRKHLKSLPR